MIPRAKIIRAGRRFYQKILASAFFLTSVCSLPAQLVPENPEINEFSGPMQFLSSEMLRGRETGTESAAIAATYLATGLQSYGLQPAGDKTSGGHSFFQEFQVISYLTHSASLSFTLGDKQLKLTNEEDFNAVSFPSDISAEGQLIFAGYGLLDQKTNTDDFAIVEAGGKIVLMLDKFPGHLDTLSPGWNKYKRFKGREDSLLLAKLQHAFAKGAVAVVLLSRDTIEQKEYYTDADHFIVPEPPENPVPVFRTTMAGFEMLAGFLGLDLDNFEKMAAEKPVLNIPEIRSAQAEMSAKTDIDSLTAVNVLGMLPGRDKGRSIVVGAHYDHLGQRGDSIYFGADDNASGTSGVLTMARNWSESSFIPACNVIFAFWSAEEKGMLGSAFYVINNQLDTSNTVAYLNFDMISRKDVTDSTQISIGLLTGTDEIERMAAEENSKLPQPFRLDLWHTNGNGGSDYVAFAKKGIPVMSFFSGFSHDYHSPRDVFAKTDPERMKMVLQLGNQCLIRLAGPAK